MSLSTLYHWMNQAGRSRYHGPQQGAVLLKNGDVVTVDLTDWQARATLNKIHHEDVVATFTKAPRGGWAGQATVKSLRGGTYSLYSSDGGDDFEATKAEIVHKLEEYEAEYARVESDPIAKLAALLKDHDWYSHFSDDFSVFSAGERSWRLIEEQAKLVDPGKARELFEQFSPKEINCPF